MMSNRKSFSLYKNKWRDAIIAEEKGDIQKSLELFKEIADELPENFAVVFRFAAISFDLDRYEDAIPYFRQAVQLDQHSEEASLGLFYCLFNTGATDDAFEEMKRFVAKNGMPESYQQLLDDINSADPQ